MLGKKHWTALSPRKSQLTTKYTKDTKDTKRSIDMTEIVFKEDSYRIMGPCFEDRTTMIAMFPFFLSCLSCISWL